MEPLVKSGTREIGLEDFKTLEIKNVSFTYPGSAKPVIHTMNLSINHTDSLAIVGLNGAGKTTLIKLLTRVYDPTEGEILINGISLKEYDLKAWKKCLMILVLVKNIMIGLTSTEKEMLMENIQILVEKKEFFYRMTQSMLLIFFWIKNLRISIKIYSGFCFLKLLGGG
jgi:ABC-type multidrug transport system fused ATPase/permease subunit